MAAPKEKQEPQARGLHAALKALKSHSGDRAMFMPPSRSYVPMRYAALGRLLSGDRHPGLPTGVFIEIVGGEFAGKTTLAFALIDAIINQPDREHKIRTDHGVEVIKAPKRVLYLDFEYALDPEYMESAIPGLVLAQTNASGKVTNATEANVFVHQPETLEEGGDVLITMTKSAEFGLAVIDSVPAMLAIEEQGKSMAQNTMGVQARAMGKFFRKTVGLVASMGITVLIINQWRDKIGVVFGDPRTSPGGKAIRYFISHKLDVSGPRRSSWFPDGKIVNIKALKNKVTGLAQNTVSYHAGNGWGLSAEAEMSELAIACGVLQQKGQKMSLMRGKEVYKQYPSPEDWLTALRKNEKLFEAVRVQCEKRGAKAQVISKQTGKGPWGDD